VRLLVRKAYGFQEERYPTGDHLCLQRVQRTQLHVAEESPQRPWSHGIVEVLSALPQAHRAPRDKVS
jgi:hypothetical protein